MKSCASASSAPMPRARAGHRLRTFRRCARCRSSRSRRFARRAKRPRAPPPSATALPAPITTIARCSRARTSTSCRASCARRTIMRWSWRRCTPASPCTANGRSASPPRRPRRWPSLARAKGIPTAIGLQARCDPTLRYARDLVAQGYVGDVLAVTMAMISPGVPERAKSKAWEAKLSGGVSALTIRGMHSHRSHVHVRRRIRRAVGAHVDADQAVEAHRYGRDDRRRGSRQRRSCTASSRAAPSSARTSARCRRRRPDFAWRSTAPTARSSSPTPGAPQRDANKLMGAKGSAALAPMDVPASYVEVPPDTPAGPPHNVAALYRRLGVAIRTRSAVEPDFGHAREAASLDRRHRGRRLTRGRNGIAQVKRGRSGRGSSPCPTPRRSRRRTSSARPRSRRPRRSHAAASSSRRRDRRACPST